MVSATQRTVDQLQEQLCEVTKERDILKEGYNQLLASTLEKQNERERREREGRITDLETRLRHALAERRRLETILQQQLGSSDPLQKVNGHLRLDSEPIGWKMYNVKSDITSPTGQQPLQPMAGLQPELQFDRRGFRQRDSDDRDLPGIGGDGRQAGWELRELQAVHAEAVQELEKARTMLLTQSKINRHFQSEVKILRKQIEDGDRDAETRSRQEHMFHIRSGRTQMLE
ncbi:protein fantom-like, partial [Scyliorhinus torazame]|uniref:protein fantom-like n=1 Tax=Scyliorhinus torazame TaxID=75743 RepID=UPI003B5B1A21